jgi:hypothetical protein
MEFFLALFDHMGGLLTGLANALSTERSALGLILFMLVSFQILMLMRASRDESKAFDLLDTLRGPDGKVRSQYIVQMACLEVALWAFLLYAVQIKLKELGIWWFLLILVGIGSPVINKLIDAIITFVIPRWAGAPPPPQAPAAPPSQVVEIEQAADGTSTTKVTSTPAAP